MITHMVLLQPKIGVTDESMQTLLQHVQALQQHVPGIVVITVGKNRSIYHSGYTYGAFMQFVDEATLEAHHSHPAHVAVVEEIDRLCERSIDCDLLQN